MPLDDRITEVEIEKITIESPEWTDYVVKNLSQNEIDEGGNPRVNGLRRLVRKFLGKVIRSESSIVQTPLHYTDSSIVRPTVAKHELVILWSHNTEIPYEVTISDCADCYHTNTKDEYVNFPTSMACTRAEARTLRKALQLNDVVASEELTNKDIFEPSEKINSTQINFIDAKSKMLDVNIDLLIKSGKKKYQSINDIDYETAIGICEYLSNIQNGTKIVPKNIVGYDKDWRNK